MEYDLLIWVAVIVGSIALVSRFVILPFVKEVGKSKKKVIQQQEQQTEELNEKNITNLAGGAAVNYVDNMLKNLEQGYMQAKDIYEQQLKVCQSQNLPPDQSEKILAPLRGKMKQAEWLLQNRDGLNHINQAMTAPLVGRLVKKIIGGFL